MGNVIVSNITRTPVESGSNWGSVAGVTPPTGATLLISDDFSSGDLSHTDNGVVWSAGEHATVVSNRGNGNSNSLRCQYYWTGETPHVDNYSNVKLDFNLNAQYRELTVQWDVYVAAGGEENGNVQYDHYNENGSSDNNKSLRVWDESETYNSIGKMGFSTINSSTGLSKSGFEFNIGTGMGMKRDPIEGGVFNYADPLFSAADRGSWVTVKYYLKAPTLADGSDGNMKAYRNGVLMLERDNIPNYSATRSNLLSTGYIHGALNGRPPADATYYIWIDNVKIWEGEA